MDQPVFVDEFALIPYDLVITIGKTVQYCFALKIPVYCYDHFGGPGYIDGENYALAKNHNFSGIGFNRKITGEGLFQDMVSRFTQANENLEFLYHKARQEFCLESNLNKLIEKIIKIQVTDIESLKSDNSLATRINDTYLDQLKHSFNLQNSVDYLQNLLDSSDGGKGTGSAVTHLSDGGNKKQYGLGNDATLVLG